MHRHLRTIRTIRTVRILVAACALAVPVVVGGATVVAASADAAASPASAASAASAARPTRFVYVRPVTASGRPADGWRVVRRKLGLTCDGASPSAVNPGIASCYPTAAGVRACWRSSHHTALCVRDAREQVLVRSHYQGDFPTVQAPAEPTPMDLVLTDGRSCLIRFGGAWSAPTQRPNWVGFDSCTRASAVYGPASSGDGIDRSHPVWTVRVWRTRPDDIVRRDVRRAWYVGDAAA